MKNRKLIRCLTALVSAALVLTLLLTGAVPALRSGDARMSTVSVKKTAYNEMLVPDGSLAELPGEGAGEKEPVKGTVTLKLGAEGFGSEAELLNYLDISLALDTEAKIADFKIGILFTAIDAIVAWDNDMPRFTVPLAGSEVYGLSEQLMKELTGAFSAQSMPALNTGAGFDKQWQDKFLSLLATLSAPGTMTEEACDYGYVWCSGTVSGRRVTYKLDKAQWKALLGDVLSLLRGNASFLTAFAQQSGLTNAQLNAFLNPDDKQLDAAAEELKDFTMTLFFADDRLCALSFGNDRAVVLYETQGTAESMLGGRTDALGVIKNGEKQLYGINTLKKIGSMISGSLNVMNKFTVSYSYEKKDSGEVRLTLALASGAQKLSLEALFTPGRVNIPVPGTPAFSITSMNELTTVLTNVLSKAFSAMTGGF